jgi:predicted transposase YbfD/YdcC
MHALGMEQVLNEYKLCFDELKLLRKTIEIQTIICDKEYLQKIIDIEEKITNISLTDEEAMLIKSVESHPTINNFIETSGFEMIKECY